MKQNIFFLFLISFSTISYGTQRLPDSQSENLSNRPPFTPIHMATGLGMPSQTQQLPPQLEVLITLIRNDFDPHQEPPCIRLECKGTSLTQYNDFFVYDWSKHDVYVNTHFNESFRIFCTALQENEAIDPQGWTFMFNSSPRIGQPSLIFFHPTVESQEAVMLFPK